jgi:hypothetical protein
LTGITIGIILPFSVRFRSIQWFIDLYVDGVLVETYTWAGSNATTDYFLRVGAESANFKRVFTGYVDEIRIWNFQLSSTFISAIMIEKLFHPPRD